MRTAIWATTAVAVVVTATVLAARGRADDAPKPAADPHLKTEAFDYKDGDVVCKGYLAHDPTISSLRPAVLVVHDWFGQGEYARKFAERVASEWGYVALAVDMYGDGKVTADPKEAGALSNQFRGEGRLKGRARIDAAFQALAALPYVDHPRTACLGFCFGGTVALELAYTGAAIRAAVSFHGHPVAPREEDSWNADFLVLHGGDDPMVPAQMLTDFQQAMRKKKGEYEIDVYSGAVHAFMDPSVDKRNMEGARYDRRAAQRAFDRCHAFLEESFAKP